METNALLEQLLVICSGIGFILISIVGIYISINLKSQNKKGGFSNLNKNSGRIHLHSRIA